MPGYNSTADKYNIFCSFISFCILRNHDYGINRLQIIMKLEIHMYAFARNTAVCSRRGTLFLERKTELAVETNYLNVRGHTRDVRVYFGIRYVGASAWVTQDKGNTGILVFYSRIIRRRRKHVSRYASDR